MSNPPPADLLTNPKIAFELLDGTWYLQYTSPSDIIENGNGSKDDDTSNNKNAWKVDPKGDDGIPVPTSFQAKGTVSAAGVTVDTSEKVVEQILDVSNSRVTNRIQIDENKVATVAGAFRPSENVPNRAIVSFDTAEIALNDGNFVISLSWLFPIIAVVRRRTDNGWLETTYVDESVRIGRGNKGTLFVLTRDKDAVAP